MITMKMKTQKILQTVAVMAAVISLTGCAAGGKAGMDAAESEEVAQMIDLVEYDFYMGSNMMAGDGGYETLRRDNDGKWVIISSIRQGISEPTVTTTYAVERDDLIRFDAFLKERDIVSLESREESHDFITDYNPWSYSIIMKDPATGKTSIHKLEEYRVYSEGDYSAIKEMDQLFAEIHGKVLSTETDK